MRTQRTLGLVRLGSCVALVLALTPAATRAQAVYSGFSDPYRINGYYAAPGNYGMAYGSMSAGVPRTYTTFSSPYGGGYGYGYAPYGLLPGRYGVGLWRPGFVTPGYAFGASYYRTFPVPYASGVPAWSPPVGVYAPAFGPPSPLSYTPPDMGW
jgi:hypothetical protein